jgi:fatty acid desaturase
MRTSPELKAHSDYASVIRPYLPPQAFAPDARHLVRIAAHLFVAVGGYLVLRTADSWWVMLPTSLVIGHSMACLLFLAHDLSHNSVVRTHHAKRGLELLLWGLNVIPPTLWRRLHNQTHHVETNTVRDTDRAYRASENTTAVWAYNRLFFPNRLTFLRHPLVLFHFVTYIVRHVVASLLPGASKPSIVTFKPHYTPAHRLAIIAELVFIGLAQLGIWWLMKGDWHRYLFAVPIPLFAASSVAMAYIWTNHMLNPLCEHTDPLFGSTSVIVPRWADWLHDNFSYHTEHHVFPGMNPRYYPEVSRLLQRHFPDRHNRIPFGEAWRQIWRQEEFIREAGQPTSPQASCPLDKPNDER